MADDDDRIGDRPRNSDNGGVDPTDPARTTRRGLHRSVEQTLGDDDRRQLHRFGVPLSRLPLLERIDASLARVHCDVGPLAGERVPLASNGCLDHADGPRETPDPDSRNEPDDERLVDDRGTATRGAPPRPSPIARGDAGRCGNGAFRRGTAVVYRYSAASTITNERIEEVIDLGRSA